jgi:hypothetical protein
VPSNLDYIQASERLAGANGAFTDTLNRALRNMLSGSGYDPDAATFPGLNGPVFNVMAFGAKGDGVTDDSGAVVDAITAAPDGSTILFPAGHAFKLVGATPTILNRTDLTFRAHGATLVLAGTNRQALLLSGTNTRIRWSGGRIVGSGVLADNHCAIGTLSTPPSGTITTDLLVSDLVFQDVVRGVVVDVSVLGDATDITYRRVFGTNVVGTGSGTGYGLVLSGVWGGTMDDCRVNAAQRHAFYVSVCKDINLSNLRSTGHLGPQGLVIARSRDVQGVNIAFDACQGNPVSIEPHESDTTADTGRIQLRNVTCTDTVAGQQDVLIGTAAPATSSLLYDVAIDGLTIKRLATETATGVESVLVRHCTNLSVRNIHYLAPAALTVTKTIVYLAAQGGASYTDNVTIAGIRGRMPNLASGGYGVGVEVNSALSGGSQRLTLRDNEISVSGGSGGQAIAYDAARTNPNIEARFNRAGNRLSGSDVLAAGTVTITTGEILTGDTVQVGRLTAGGTLGHLSLGTIVNRTSFVINSSSATDTSTVAWEIVH